MEIITISILTSVIGLGVGAASIVIYYNKKADSALKKADEIIEKAKKDAEKVKRDSILELKEESHKLKLETDKEIKEKKQEIKDLEDRLFQREKNLDKRDEILQNRDKMLEDRDNALILKQKEIQKAEEEMENLKKKEMEMLESISGFTKEKAREMIMSRVESALEVEITSMVKEREMEAKLEIDKKAKDMLVSSMQKYASDVTNEKTVSVVNLPNDDMKGRIIGREGRNIRTIEAVTGVDLIIDDTPEAIVLSSFDPLRREIAKETIEILIKDGRIHPGRIEELYDKVCKDFNIKILEYGNQAAFELGLSKLDPELVEILGKLYFRTSYGQNALQHSKEVAHLSGIIAAELGENVAIAKRAGLLHDIGKAVDFEVEGSHVEVGVELATKYNEDKIVINAIASHHGDTEANSIISVIVSIADALSASRPGARNDSLENYIKRLQQLEEIANGFDGVEKSYAIQAGRELRVLVKPDKIDDLKSFKVARDIKNKIEEEMQYPGTVKITVIRELRAVEEAK